MTVPPPGDPLTSEHLEFLSRHSRVFLLVRDGDRPVGYPMTGRLIDGALEFSTYRKSAKVRHIERDERVCCVTVPRDSPEDNRALVTWGGAAINEQSRANWLSVSGRERASTGIAVPPEVVKQVSDRIATNKRVVVRVELLSARFIRGSQDAS
jgi:Pyridoxamine 5'-phosphate oxidase